MNEGVDYFVQIVSADRGVLYLYVYKQLGQPQCSLATGGIVLASSPTDIFLCPAGPFWTAAGPFISARVGDATSIWNMGPPLTVVEAVASNPDLPPLLAYDVANVYRQSVSSGGWTIESVPRGGGDDRLMASGDGGAAGCSASTSGFAQARPPCLAVDSSGVYFADGQAISRVGLDGGAVTPIVTAQPTAIAVNPAGLYWVESGAIHRAAPDGGAGGVFWPGAPSWLAADDSGLYWTQGTALYFGSVDGGAPRSIAAAPFQSQELALDSTSVYWRAGPEVLVTPKP